MVPNYYTIFVKMSPNAKKCWENILYFYHTNKSDYLGIASHMSFLRTINSVQLLLTAIFVIHLSTHTWNDQEASCHRCCVPYKFILSVKNRSWIWKRAGELSINSLNLVLSQTYVQIYYFFIQWERDCFTRRRFIHEISFNPSDLHLRTGRNPLKLSRRNDFVLGVLF